MTHLSGAYAHRESYTLPVEMEELARFIERQFFFCVVFFKAAREAQLAGRWPAGNEPSAPTRGDISIRPKQNDGTEPETAYSQHHSGTRRTSTRPQGHRFHLI